MSYHISLGLLELGRTVCWCVWGGRWGRVNREGGWSVCVEGWMSGRVEEGERCMIGRSVK